MYLYIYIYRHFFRNNIISVEAAKRYNWTATSCQNSPWWSSRHLKGTLCQCCAGMDYGTKPSGSIKAVIWSNYRPLLRKSKEPNFWYINCHCWKNKNNEENTQNKIRCILQITGNECYKQNQILAQHQSIPVL